jgi:hypothetical protein
VVDVFDVYDKLRERSDGRANYQRGLLALAREALTLRAQSSDEATWRSSAEYATWWEKQGDFVKRSRGNLLSLSRTFALLKDAAFSPRAPADARAAFARFGDFDHYLTSFFDDLTIVRQTPGLEDALADLAKRDTFLADGVEFAIAQFKLHVLDHVYPTKAESAEVMRRVAEFVPKVNDDYRAALGFSPGLESGVPFYDALRSFVRADAQATAGTDVLRRLNVVQRGLQSWTQTYFLKQAYKILFDRELDEEDPTPLPAESRTRGLVKRSVGDAVHEFLDSKLPQRLARETGSHDMVSWLAWLMENGELTLDAEPRGKNPYAEAISSYEQRLAEYQTRIRLGEATGKNVRAERQRVLDIEREYSSLRRRVSALQANAAQQANAYLKASRDYREAIWQSALWLFGVIVCGFLARRAARTAAPAQARTARWLSFAGAMCLLALGLLPFWVATNPARAERWAGRPLHALRLLESSEDSAQPRGVAAQLDRTRPWTVLAAATRKQGNR